MNANDYIEAALKVAETVPEPTPDPNEGKLEAVGAPAPEPKTEVKTEVKAEAKPEVKPDRLAKGFEDLAREKAEMRAAKQAWEKERGEIPAALLTGLRNKDAVAILAASGIPLAQAARQLLEGGSLSDPEKKKVEPESELAKEVQSLKAEIQAQKATAARNGMINQIREKAKDNPKYRFTAGKGAENQVMGYLERYFAETGELPGENLDSSLEIALEAVENRLSREAESWAKLLQGSTGPNPVKQAAPSTTVSQQVAKTLTNDTGSGPKSSNGESRVRKTENDYIAEAMKIVESFPSE